MEEKTKITNIRRIPESDSYEIEISLTLSREEIIGEIPKDIVLHLANEIYKQLRDLTSTPVTS